MKRVLHVRGSSSLLGAERVVLELCRMSPEFGYSAALCVPVDGDCPEPELVAAARAQGTDTLTVPFRSPFSLGSARRIRESMKRFRADVIHTHGYREDLYALWIGGGTRLVATNHLWKKTTRRLRFYAAMDAWILRTFDHVVAVSRPVAAATAAAGIAPSRLSVINNGIGPVAYADGEQDQGLREEFPGGGSRILLVSVSSLTPEKGHRFALQALRALLDEGFDFHWFVVGEGRCEAELRSVTESLGLSRRVTFTGYRKDAARFLRAADIFLLPSLDEGLPISLLEAMWCGPAVVGTRVGDVGIALDGGRCGFLADPGDERSLMDALRSALSSADGRRSASAAAHRRVTEVFSAQAMTRAYCALYDRLLNEAP